MPNGFAVQQPQCGEAELWSVCNGWLGCTIDHYSLLPALANRPEPLLSRASKSLLRIHGKILLPFLEPPLPSKMLPPQSSPDLIHYLPLGTTAISGAFLTVLIRSGIKKSWPPHILWWAIGVFFYGLGTCLESMITLLGNSPELNRWWYWAGAILGGYPLATGSVYLVFRNRTTANLLTGLSLALVLSASVAIFLTPLRIELLDPVRPSGNILSWQWIRALTPFINIYAAVFLIGTAAQSSVRFGRSYRGNARSESALSSPLDQNALLYRAWGTSLIAIGALLPGIGGSLTKTNDLPEALYTGEFIGIILIWAGHHVCSHFGRNAG